MSDLYDQIVRQRGSFENLLARIPGFRGYLENATRRTADQMLRAYIADQLRQRIQRFVSIEEMLLRRQDGLRYMTRSSEVKAQLQSYRDRIAAAVPEFGGFASAVKVDDEALERIYAFDEAQVRYIEQIDAALDALEQAVARVVEPEPITQNEENVDAESESTASHENDMKEVRSFDDELTALERLIREAQEAFALRDQVLTNLHKTYSS